MFSAATTDDDNDDDNNDDNDSYKACFIISIEPYAFTLIDLETLMLDLHQHLRQHLLCHGRRTGDQSPPS